MSKFSNPRPNIFIVQNNQQYPELVTLTDTLRSNINDVVITRANYSSLHKLVKSISQTERNMIIILTKDLSMDAQLVAELEKAHDKNVKVLLYPRGFISNNRYQVVNNPDQIIQVAVLYFTGVMNEQIASYKSQFTVEPASPIKKIQNIDRFQNIQMASSMQNNTIKSLSSMANQQISTKLIILQGRDKQFNSLMSTLSIRYKNDPKVQCREIVNIQQINGLTDNRSRMILIIHEDQIDQRTMFLLQQLRNRMSIIKYTNNPNPLINNLFELQTNRVEAIQYFVSPQQVYAQGNRQPSIMASNTSNVRSNNLMSSSLSPNRIQMKSAQKIIKSLNSRSQNPTQLYAYQSNNNPYFTEFYSKIPTNFKVISHISQVPPNRQSIIISPIQQASSIVQNIPPTSKLVLFANNMSPNNFISHPSVNMVTSNRQHLMSYLMKQNITFNNRSFVNNASAQTKIIESIRDLNLSNVHQGAFPNGQKFMCWTVKGENGEYQTFVGDKPDYSDIKLNNASTKVQSYLNQMPTQFGSNDVSSVARPLVGAVSKTQINEIKSNQNFNSSHLNHIIANQAINNMNNNAVNQIIVNSHAIPSSVSIKQTIVQPIIPQQQQYLIKSNKLNSSRVQQVQYLPQTNINKVYNYEWDVGLNKQSQNYETNSLNPTPQINSIITTQTNKIGNINQFIPSYQVTTNKIMQPIVQQINYSQKSNNPSQMQWYAYRNANNQFILSSQNPIMVNNNFSVSNNKDTTSQQIHSQYFMPPENNKIESTINYEVLVRPPSSSVIAEKYLYKPSTAVIQQIKYIPPQNQMLISTKTPIKSTQHIEIVQKIPYNQSQQNILPPVLPPPSLLPTINNVVLNTIPTQTTQTLITQNIKQLIDGNNMITFNDQGSKINSKLEDNTPSFIKKQLDLDVFSNTVSLLIKPQERKIMKQDQMPSIVITPTFNPTVNNEIVSQLSNNSNNHSQLILINNSTVKNNKSINSNVIQIRTQTAANPYVETKQHLRPSYNYQMNDHIIETINKIPYQDNINVGIYNPRQSKSLDNRVSMRTSKAPKLNVSYKQNYQPYVALERSKQRYRLNSTDYDVSQQNGVKVYRRKTQSLAPSKFIDHLNTPLMKKVQDVYKPRPSNVTIVNQLKQSFDQPPYKILQQPLNEKSLYYNTDISSKQHILNIPKPPKQSRVSYSNEYMGGVRGINVTTAPRVSQFNNTSINNTSLRQSQSSSSSKKQLVVFVLSHYHQTELQDYLKQMLPNRVHILKYHDQRSMTQKALESIDENLVCILNTTLHNLDSKLQDIHPNVSIITFDRQKHLGTHPASTQHEVLSMIKKWYFQY